MNFYRLIHLALALFLSIFAGWSQNAQQDPVEQREKQLLESIDKEVERLRNLLDLEYWQEFYVDSTLTHDLHARMDEMLQMQQAKVENTDLYQTISDKWMEQIEPLLGDTHMIVYPNGDYIKGTDPRAVFLKNNGFRIFFGIGPRPYYIYGDNYLYYDRTIINGRALRNSDLSRLFNADEVIETFE